MACEWALGGRYDSMIVRNMPMCERATNFRDFLNGFLGGMGMSLVHVLHLRYVVPLAGFIARDRFQNLYVVFSGMYDWSAPQQNQRPSMWDQISEWPHYPEQRSIFTERRARQSCRVAGRYLHVWNSVRDLVKVTLQQTHPLGQNGKLHFIGHALGGPLATIGALDFSLAGIENDPVVFTTGCPPAGNPYFADLYDLKIEKSWRVFLENDWTPHLPLHETNMWGFKHSRDGYELKSDGKLLPNVISDGDVIPGAKHLSASEYVKNLEK